MRNRSPLKFFLLVFALSIPFWLLGALTGVQLLPGLPITALIACCPVIAAAILVYQEGKTAAVAELLKRALDFQRIKAKVWYAPTLLLMPVVMALSLGVLRLTGTPVPPVQIALLPTLILGIVFFISATAEELGWSGYAIDSLRERWGALPASIILGLIWAAFHYVALAQAQRSAAWIAWWSLGTVAARVIIVWLYNNTGKSVFAAALFHMTIDVTWQLYPVSGSSFDPRLSGLITALIAAIIVVIWGPRTLTRYAAD
jgi:membrane protease YdiL (CAAX protease family)